MSVHALIIGKPRNCAVHVNAIGHVTGNTSPQSSLTLFPTSLSTSEPVSTLASIDSVLDGLRTHRRWLAAPEGTVSWRLNSDAPRRSWSSGLHADLAQENSSYFSTVALSTTHASRVHLFPSTIRGYRVESTTVHHLSCRTQAAEEHSFRQRCASDPPTELPILTLQICSASAVCRLSPLLEPLSSSPLGRRRKQKKNKNTIALIDPILAVSLPSAVCQTSHTASLKLQEPFSRGFRNFRSPAYACGVDGASRGEATFSTTSVLGQLWTT